MGRRINVDHAHMARVAADEEDVLVGRGESTRHPLVFLELNKKLTSKNFTVKF